MRNLNRAPEAVGWLTMAPKPAGEESHTNHVPHPVHTRLRQGCHPPADECGPYSTPCPVRRDSRECDDTNIGGPQGTIEAGEGGGEVVHYGEVTGGGGGGGGGAGVRR